jgi:hypothetical protein
LKTCRLFPTEDTITLLAKLFLLFKQTEDGFTLLFNSLIYGRKREKQEVVESGAVLHFYLVNTDSYFMQYTDQLDRFQPGKSLLHFTNQFADHLLHPEPFASDALITGEQLLPEQLFFSTRPFAVVSLHLAALTLPAYTIQFAARATYWRYILAATYLQQLEKPLVIGKQDKIPFQGPQYITLPDNTKAICFVSNDKIPFSETPGREWQLVEQYDAATGKYKVVKKALPAPDLQHLSVIDQTVDTASLRSYSEIIL